jgi:adenine deaminase
MASDLKEKLIAVARGDLPADLLFKRARVLNVFTGEVEKAQSVAISSGRIVGIGDYSEAEEEIDLGGAVLAPGFIDSHIHLESTHLRPGDFAELVIGRGTTTVVADPHEIANVCGMAGLRYMIKATADLPLTVFFMVPSCVPATHLETSGAKLNAEDIADALQLERVIGLAEMMNYPGVIFGDREVLAKLEVAKDVVIDGHCPGLTGRQLNAYLVAGIGSDHETTVLAEGREKIRRGMHLMIREGSSEKNLETLYSLITPNSAPFCLFATDDRSPVDLQQQGHIDHIVRKAIRLGVPRVRAYTIASLNAARYFGLKNYGAIAPGYRADMIVVQDLKNVKISAVYHGGKQVARDGKSLVEPTYADDAEVIGTFEVGSFLESDLRIAPPQGKTFPVIEIIPGQIVTGRLDLPVTVDGDRVKIDLDNDVIKLAVVERHTGSGNIGIGLIKGLGLKRGAIASSIAHDSHNIIVAGTNDADMVRAVAELTRLNGGLVVIDDGEVLAAVALPIAGLISDKGASETVESYQALNQAVKQLGTDHPTPFETLAFMALPVIPELKLTDKGLVDVTKFELIKEI